MRLYVSGPMAGVPEKNHPLFNQVAQTLDEQGYEVSNPVDNPEQDSWENYLRQDIKMLMECDGLATLPGWEASPGARLEVYIASALSMTVKGWEEWKPEPERCEWEVFSGSPNPDSPNFGPPEYCEEDALPGESYCAAHLPWSE